MSNHGSTAQRRSSPLFSNYPRRVLLLRWPATQKAVWTPPFETHSRPNLSNILRQSLSEGHFANRAPPTPSDRHRPCPQSACPILPDQIRGGIFLEWNPTDRHNCPMLRRYLYVLMFAWWMGGLTFYAVIVIPTAAHVLGKHRDVGFITRQVTLWLNLTGIIPLLVFLWNLVADQRLALGWRRGLFIGTGLAMATVQVALFVAHAWLGGILDPARHRILDPDTFRFRHGLYETLVTILWLAALCNAWLSLGLWQVRDRND